MRTSPLLLALQGPEIDTRSEEDPEATITTESTENMKLQPNNPPVIAGKQDGQDMHLNVTKSQILRSMPVPDDNEGIKFDGIISTSEPITEDETIGTTDYSTDHTMRINNVDYETQSFVESPDYTSDYLEPETSTLLTTMDNQDTEWSTVSKTEINDFKDESLTTVTAVEFEFPTERTFVTIEDAEMHETSTITEASEIESSTDSNLYTNTETPILSNILNFPHIETLKNKTAVVPDLVTDKNIFLEASPTTGVSDVTDVPLTDASKFDFKIVTTRKGLQVDAHDTVFDPTQIAKATSYEGSSYSTATRSATVTTWLDPNDRNIILLKQSNSSSNPVSESSTLILHSGMEDNISITPTHTLSDIHEEDLLLKNPGDEIYQDRQEITTAAQGENNVNTEVTTNAAEITTNYDTDPDGQNVLEETDFQGKKGVNLHKHEMKISGDRLFNNTISDARIPIGKLSNLSSINVRNDVNTLYELPEANLNSSSDLYFSTSVIIALSVCCSIALLAGLMTLILWLCRRHRSRSKIYLSREAAKPRAFFTKPMNPALLPDESFEEPRYVLEFQQPRAPIMLGSDHEDAVFKPKNSDDFCIGLENDGFTDIPLEELKVEGYKKNKRLSQDPPKYGSKAKIESDNDSGIRVWSSTGSLYTASPQLTHCSVPPPPYSPSIGEEPACLSVHSLPSLSKKLGSLDI